MIGSCIQEDQEDSTTPTANDFQNDEIDSMVVLRNKENSIEDVRIDFFLNIF